MSDTGFEFSLTRNGTKDNDAGAGLQKWAQLLQTGMAVAGRDMPQIFRDHLARISNEVARRNNNRWPGGTTATSVSSRSGNLLDSLREGIRVTGTTFDVQCSIGGVEYLKIQEYGGTLTPSSGQYLAIPLEAALNSDGTPIKANPRDWDKTFVQMSKAGNLLVFRRNGAGITPLYALKATVTVPARLGARKVAAEQMPYLRQRVLDAVLKRLR